MNCDSETSLFHFPVTPSDYSHDFLKIEDNASKALRNIHLIYNDIMSPKECNLEEPNNFFDARESSSHSFSQQSHYVKTCCSTLRELCIKCERYIARCSSCNRCKCNVLNNNLKKVENSENIDGIYECNGINSSNLKIQCTVPIPFSFYEKNEDRLKAKEKKISKIKQEYEDRLINELKIRPNFKQVPKNTHFPLYNQMVQEKEKRKAERKEKCLEILNSAKPFNLHSLKRSEKAKSSSDLAAKNTFNFKAKPVPKHILSSKVSEKLKNKEEIRKMLIGERAKQTIEQSSSPFSKKPVTYSYSLTNLCNLNKTQTKEHSKPKNISEITERLYIKKCNDTMNNWNRKVLQVDENKNIKNMDIENLLMNEHMLLSKKHLNKVKELPFMYFPVRMSNAAIQREKLIR